MNSSDNNPGGMGEPGDLRFALNAMNHDLNMTPDDYEILFDTPMTIQLNGILPIINNSPNPMSITIGNSGSIPTVTIDGNSGAYSGFLIPTGNVTIRNMIFQNLTAKGGDGGNGISGGGGGMGAGGGFFVPQSFLHGSDPSITLMNVSISHCSAVGGTGGSYLGDSSTGNEGGGGGGGFSGNGGSITTFGSTGGGGGGGYGGNGGDVTQSLDADLGGGGGGGGGIGSRATMGILTNLGDGGSDQDLGSDGNGYGLSDIAGSGGGGHSGGNFAGGGGGGGAMAPSAPVGGGGGGSDGLDGTPPLASTPPGGDVPASGGLGGGGGGGGGGGIVMMGAPGGADGSGGDGGTGGGGGGGAGVGFYDAFYHVQGGTGGLGGGGGGGGVDQSGVTSAEGGSSLGGGGGGGGGPSGGGMNTPGGSDTGHLGGGSGGFGDSSAAMGSGGGGGGGGSGLGGAIFVDSGLNFTIQALPGIPTTFNTPSNTTVAGVGGNGGPGGTNGMDGSALGNSIFLRTASSLTFIAEEADDLLILGDEVAFTDDTSFSAGGTNVYVTGNGTVVYNGTTDYQGSITVNNANFKVNGTIEEAPISVCRNSSFSLQRGTLSGIGILTGDVSANSGAISPDAGGELTLGSLTLNSADVGSLGSLVHIEIDASGTSLVTVTGSAALAGILEVDIDPNAIGGAYTILTSSGITGTFDSVVLPGEAPTYSLSYLPIGAPTFVQFEFVALPPSNPTLSTQGLTGNNLRVANYLNSLATDASSLGLTDQFVLLNNLSFSQYQNALEAISPSRNSISTFAAQNVMFLFSESLNSHFTNRRLAARHANDLYLEETALQADNALVAINQSPRKTMYAPPKNTNSQIWAMGFGQLAHQTSQDQTPAFDFNSGGLFVAYDYGDTDRGCIGALAGYAHSSIQQQHSLGNGHFNAGYFSIYGMGTWSDFFIDASIWGEYMSVAQKRAIHFPGFDETAKSSYHAEQLDLHFGTGYDFNIESGTIEPFGLLDWAVEWDPSYSEEGAAPYNMKISSRTSWMLRLETGLNGYKTTTYDWGVFIAQMKLSYVYKKPHDVGHLNAAILTAPSSFVVEAFTTSQSLFSPALELFAQTNWNGYGSIRYDGEFGSGYYSNQFYGKIGYAF